MKGRKGQKISNGKNIRKGKLDAWPCRTAHHRHGLPLVREPGIQLSAASSGLSRNFGDRSALANGREMPLGAFGLGMTHCGPANNGGPALPAWRRPPKT